MRNVRQISFFISFLGMFWMAVDNIFRGVSQRWAYIAVAIDRREGSDEHIKRITDFIAEFYPLIVCPKSEVRSQRSDN